MDIKIIASGSSGNCYQICDGSTALLLDCGITIKRIECALDFRLHLVSGVMVTHCHEDHIKAAKDIAGRGIPVYASKGTLEEKNLTGIFFKAIQHKESFKIGTFTIMPFDVEHDAPEPLGFFIKSSVTGEKLLYFTDTYYLKYKFKGINYLMAECNYSRKTMDEHLNPVLKNRIIESHMSLETLLDMLKANDFNKLKRVYLLHLSDSNSDAEYFKREIQAVTGVEVYVC